MSSAALKMDEVGIESFADELKPGTQLLLGQFTIDSFLNAGGFGITYLARDSLNRRVVIKECFPSSFCRRTDTIVAARSRQRQDEFRSIVTLFLQEAFNLSRLDHPNIVKVHQVFQDNETAYMAMDHIQGPDLLETIEGTAPKLTKAQITTALHKMLDALGYVHAQGFLHRDISPDNILLDSATDEPVLIDFGAARKDVTRKSRALSGLRVVKDGYSPQEFYISGGKQAPCSDLYALAATFCHLISGETPKTSQERLSSIANREGDPQLPLLGRVTGYPAPFLAALDKAMSIFPRDRLQSVAEWQALLREGTPVPSQTAPSQTAPSQNAPAQSGAMPPNQPVAAVVLAASDAQTAPHAQVTPVSAPAAPGSRDILMSSAAAVLLLAGLLSLPSDALDRAKALWAGGREVAVSSVEAAGVPFGQTRLVQTRLVRLPYAPDPAAPDRVAAVLPWSPDWVTPGLRIVEVNGSPVQDGADIPAMLAEGVDLATEIRINGIFGYEQTPGADIVRKRESLPVVDELRLPDGLTFQMEDTPTGTRTVVAALPVTGTTDLHLGDVLLVYSRTGETLGTATALADILLREISADVATYDFAVQRMDGMAVGSFRLSGAD